MLSGVHHIGALCNITPSLPPFSRDTAGMERFDGLDDHYYRRANVRINTCMYTFCESDWKNECVDEVRME